MSLTTTTTLNNGNKMPMFGLGVFRSEKNTYDAVRYALDIGYRHIDTAMIYENEAQVGKAIKDSGISREDIFVTTKLWNDDIRKKQVRQAYEKSLSLLGMEYVDLYLMHWAVKEEFVNAYAEMEKLYLQGKIKAIGTSNFQPHHLETLKENFETIPAVNQIECHPYLSNNAVVEYCQNNGIVPEAWSPIAKGKIIGEMKLADMVSKYGKTEAQIALRWNLQRGVIIIPKSIRKERIKENSEIFDFELNEQEMKTINNLDKNMRLGSHPDNFDF